MAEGSDRSDRLSRTGNSQELILPAGPNQSSFIYCKLSQSVGFNRCADQAFVALKATLQQCFR